MKFVNLMVIMVIMVILALATGSCSGSSGAETDVSSTNDVWPDLVQTDLPATGDVAADLVEADDVLDASPDLESIDTMEEATDTVQEVSGDAEQDLQSAVSAILQDHGIPQMTVLVDETEIDAQALAYPGPVTFLQALDSVIVSFMTDDADPECPLNILMDVELVAPCDQSNVGERLRCYMNMPTTTLQLVTREGQPWPPEEAEPIAENWVFFLSLSEFSDVLHWGIVDRAGVNPTYNYGFN